MSKVNVMITIDPCCERIKFLSDILAQSRSLNLNESYQLAIECLILDMMSFLSSQDLDAITTTYDNGIDNILARRESAFLEWMNDVKNRFVPVPKTP